MEIPVSPLPFHQFNTTVPYCSHGRSHYFGSSASVSSPRLLVSCCPSRLLPSPTPQPCHLAFSLHGSLGPLYFRAWREFLGLSSESLGFSTAQYRTQDELQYCTIESQASLSHIGVYNALSMLYCCCVLIAMSVYAVLEETTWLIMSSIWRLLDSLTPRNTRSAA